MPSALYHNLYEDIRSKERYFGAVFHEYDMWYHGSSNGHVCIAAASAVAVQPFKLSANHAPSVITVATVPFPRLLANFQLTIIIGMAGRSRTTNQHVQILVADCETCVSLPWWSGESGSDHQLASENTASVISFLYPCTLTDSGTRDVT